MKISIIGAGNMGGAIARGLATSSIVSASDITVTDHAQAVLDKISADVPAIHTVATNSEAAAGADIVILAVKPWLVETVISEIKPVLDLSRQLFICIAAGVTFAQLNQFIGSEEHPLVRVIPNTAIAIKQSPTLISVYKVNDAQLQLVKDIFNELGQAIVIEERLMNEGTAVTSCGIAYAFEYIKASIQGAIELGFYPHVAKAMIDQTVAGAVALLEANGSMPDEEIYKVCTPGGITIKGINELSACGFDHAVVAALKKSAGK